MLVSAGNVKRDRIQRIKETAVQRGEQIEESKIAENLPEQEILIQSICETMVPKLVAEDIPLLFSLLSDVFPGISYTPAQMAALKDEITKICKEEYLVCGENSWMEKVRKSRNLDCISFTICLACLRKRLDFFIYFFSSWMFHYFLSIFFILKLCRVVFLVFI